MAPLRWSSPVDEQPADQSAYQVHSVPTPLSLADIRTILGPYRNFLEAAIEAAPAPKVIKVTRLPDSSLEGNPEAYELQSIDLPEDGSAPADTPVNVKRAYKYLHLCGTACVVLLTALRTELSRRSIPAQSSWAKVEMIRVLPLAKVALFWEQPGEGMGPPVRYLGAHGALKITLSTGEEMVLDLTHGQFGHTPEDWLMPLGVYLSKYTSTELQWDGEYHLYKEGEIAAEVEAMRDQIFGWYWIEVKGALELSFHNKKMRKLFVSMSAEEQKICASYQCRNIREKYQTF